MLRDWISSKKEALTPSSSTHSLDRSGDIHDLEEALNATGLVFDDDLEGAERGLARGQSAFHKLGRGMVQFIRASLGFEADVMQQAADTLAEAESISSKELRKAQKDPKRSRIYDAGSEFALINAMSQLMSAVLAVFRESIVDGMKGFLKLNSAFKTLQKIVDAEEAYIAKRSAHRTVPNTPNVALFSRDIKSVPTTPIRTGIEDLHISNRSKIDQDDDSDDEEFFDADESDELHPDHKTYAGKLEINGHLQEALTRVKPPPPANALDENDLDSPMDVFVHSGATLCYGMMLLMLSLVPPALSKLLNIVGYRGDRRRGLRMLWSSSRHPNAIGALAGLVLLAYHNALIGIMDMIPLADPSADLYSDDNLDGYPAEQLESLLHDMQRRFPESKIWLIEQARMLSVERKLDQGLALLKGNLETPLKQVQALAVFERSLQAMYSHEYAFCTESFKECCERNNWSHALYMYTAGAAQVELYRIAQAKGALQDAQQHALEATKLIKEAKDKTGKRKAFGRQLPFDAFVTHKVNKWEARALALNIPFIDAIGVSPTEEMIFLWNGFRKMPEDYLWYSMDRLTWSETASPDWSQEDIDEKALLSLLRAILLRSLGRYDEAMAILTNNVLSIDKSLLKGANKEDWVLPAAHYEMAVNLWLKAYRAEVPGNSVAKGNPGKTNPIGTGEHGRQNKKLMREAEEWLDKVSKWEGYMLDARLGLRITAGLDTVRRWRAKHDS